MNQSINEGTFVVREYPLDGLFSYIAVLMQRAPGGISFRTGSGRIYRDLLLHWPTMDEWEDEAQELCQRIADAVFPLASSLYAQAVEINITISAGPIMPPSRIDAMASYIIFDADQRMERHFFLSPRDKSTDTHLLEPYKGIVVLCRPLNYRYHTIKDDRGRGRGAGPDAFGYTEKLINQMLDAPDFVPREQKILAAIKAEVKALPQIIERALSSRAVNLSKEIHHIPQVTPAIASVTALSALPPPIRALERRLFASITDKSLSADLRLGLRRVAQELRGHYPHVFLEEAARLETAHPVLKVGADMKPLTPQAQVVAPRSISVAKPQMTVLPHGDRSIAALDLQRASISQRPLGLDISMPKVPLSVRPSTVLPTERPRPQPQVGPIYQPLRQGQRAEGPAVQPTTQASRRPTQEPSPTSRQQPTARAEARQPAQQPQRVEGPTAQPEARVNRQPAQEPTQTPRQQPATPKAELKPNIERQNPQPQVKQQPFVRQELPHMSLEKLSPQLQATPRQREGIARRFPDHRFEWDPQARPKSFYEPLKNFEAKPFPKATPIAPVGALDKTVKLKLEQRPLSLQANLHKEKLTATLPKMMPEPFPRFF